VASALNPQLIGQAGANTYSSISGAGNSNPQLPGGAVPVGVSPVAHLSTSLELRQLLFDFNQTRNLVQLNRALVNAAESNLTKAQEDVAQAVKISYYALASAESLVRVNEQNIANRQRQLDLANARFKNGLGQPSDVVVAETSKSQAVVALNAARDQAEQARITLLLNMGLNPLTPISTVSAEERPLPQTEPQALISQAIQCRPEVRAAKFALVAARSGLSAAKALNQPTIYAAGILGSNGNQYPLANSVTGLAVGVNFPILDGGQRKGAIKTAQGQAQGAEADLQTTVDLVQADVAGSYIALKSVEQRVGLVAAEVANAREGVRLAEGRYAEGFGSFLDIITAQNLLLGALTDQTNVKGALNLARTKLRHALGHTLAL
jgi:outer membrane protein